MDSTLVFMCTSLYRYNICSKLEVYVSLNTRHITNSCHCSLTQQDTQSPELANMCSPSSPSVTTMHPLTPLRSTG